MKFIEDGVRELLKARRVLCGSYVYGYYLEDDGYNKTIFEFMQVCLQLLCNSSPSFSTCPSTFLILLYISPYLMLIFCLLLFNGGLSHPLFITDYASTISLNIPLYLFMSYLSFCQSAPFCSTHFKIYAFLLL